jgi:hypothetical protein
VRCSYERCALICCKRGLLGEGRFIIWLYTVHNVYYRTCDELCGGLVGVGSKVVKYLFM